MGLFGKNKKEEEGEIPSLPELPTTDRDLVLPSKADLPEVPAGLPEIETQELPSIPNIEPIKTPQEIIKTAVSAPKMQKSRFDIKETGPLPPLKPLKQPDLPRTLEITPEGPKTFGRQIIKKAEPIYIRLDKFETTVETFEEIKNKIEEIEELLQKTKEIKQKEEQELIEWEREIQMIKVRIESIDRNIFNKLD